ncbi:Endo-beta 1,4-glucanase [Acidilobus saccharovorans 345-15]|uniref:Endo-beta 1,4-glucanase n=1 Tax=Acidilobus saccharovorans (strain DSM 16705 / JCM 18335 / VKM B-2471 / 345-15) TaxID=666510 RepID=D9PZ33_ACIS3|nr:endo-beta 1,4-glucanase [Acidilobus saccharovorans]ADL19820.1 Endo-beta 1,4-glucanase [Acidilobus saccharovorans 345-15]
MASLGGYLNLVPPSGLRDCVAASSTKAGESSWVTVKDPQGHGIAVDPNPWNTWEGSGSSSVKLCSDGLDVVVSYSEATAARPPETVLGYPEVIYGYKPWGALSTPTSPLLQLPAKVGQLPQALVYVDYSVEFPNGRGNLAFDLWLTRGPGQNGVGPRELEVMIWLYRTPGFNPMGYQSPSSTLALPTIVNGRPGIVNWGVYIADPMGPGRWTYVAFTLEPPLASGSVVVPLTLVLRSLRDLLPWGNEVSDLYLNGLELGMEYTSLTWPPTRVSVMARYRLNSYGVLVLPQA